MAAFCRPNIIRSLSTHSIIRPGQKINIEPHSSPHPKRAKAKTKDKHSSNVPFIDRINIRARAGDGGRGCISFHRIGSYKKRPSGGHGGKGGNVYLVTDPNVGTLKMEKHHFKAVDGGKGGTNGKAGKNGSDIFVRVPAGVVVRRVLDWEEVELFGDDVNIDDDLPLFSNGDEWNSNEDTDRMSEEDDTSNNLDYNTTNDSFEDTYHIGDDNHMSINLDCNTTNDTFENGTENDDQDTQEDFDAYYANLNASRRARLSRRKRRDRLPTDYDDIVNQEVRAEDGMYHWTSPEAPNDLAEELTDTAYSNQAMERKSIFVADLDKPHTSLLIAKGGKAGVGNQAYANRQHTQNLTSHAVQKALAGAGEITHLELELKLIADVGLVGFPNAGKSSLLSAMSRARPKIASYPFTTLHPLVGTIQYKDDFKIVMADVPGLIDGAADGRGRGVEFLRHIERTKALVYIVDGASMDGRCPVSDLRILGKELKEYGSSGYFDDDEIHIEDDTYKNFEEEMKRRRREIMNRPSIILANKMDMFPINDVGLGRREEILDSLSNAAEEVGIVCEKENILGISAGVSGEGLQILSKRLRSVLDK